MPKLKTITTTTTTKTTKKLHGNKTRQVEETTTKTVVWFFRNVFTCSEEQRLDVFVLFDYKLVLNQRRRLLFVCLAEFFQTGQNKMKFNLNQLDILKSKPCALWLSNSKQIAINTHPHPQQTHKTVKFPVLAPKELPGRQWKAKSGHFRCILKSFSANKRAPTRECGSN